MKKPFFLLTITFFGIFTLAGCGKTAEKANTEAPKAATPETPLKVDELVTKATAEKDVWKGKEVTVSGIVTFRSSINLGLVTKKWDNQVVVCVVQTPPTQNVDDTVEVKGKINEFVTQGESTAVKLEPCEVKK